MKLHEYVELRTLRIGTLFKISVRSPVRIVCNGGWVGDGESHRLIMTAVIAGANAGQPHYLAEHTQVVPIGTIEHSGELVAWVQNKNQRGKKSAQRKSKEH